MARRTNSRPWLQVFQKPKSEIRTDRAPSDPPVLLEENPESEHPPHSASTHQQRYQALSQQGLRHLRHTTRALASVTQVTRQRVRPLVQAWKWQLIWLSILAIFGGTGMLAFLWLSKVPPAVDCKQISAWSAESERLFCAQEAARSGKPEAILGAINLVKNWTSENPLYGQSQLLLQDWSNALLMIARDRVSQRDLKGGVALANQIPKVSPVYKEAQAAIEQWQAEYRRGEAIYNKIQTALKQQKWNLSSDFMAQLTLVNDASWQDRLGEIREQINAEKAGWKFLTDARNFAKTNPQERWGQAIALTDPINRKTYAWTLFAQKDVTQWRNTIFSLAIAQFDQQNISVASSLIKSLPQSVQLTSANRDFVRLVQARQLVANENLRAPSIDRLVPLMLATHLLKQISPQSPFFDRAKVLIPRLEQHTQDVAQLNLAGTLANLQQLPTLNIAIAQAKSISLKRPGRLYAQTLLAQWQKEKQSLEDRPLLRQAQQVAKTGKLGQLRTAVAMAKLIQPKRALRTEAQTEIANWTSQIQVLEDRPIIAEAQSIANAGRLGEAIQVASRVRAGRALYGEAQNLIGGWIYQIQIVEDRATLARASGLANGGYLTRAIDLASAITPGRALYGEAQGLISQWAVERAEIWRQRAAEAAPVEEPYSEPSPESSPSESPESDPEPTPP